MSLLRRLFPASKTPPPGFPNGPHPEAAPAQQMPDAIDGRSDVLAQAERLVASSRFAESLALVGSALLATPNDPDLLFAKGRALHAWGRAREAIDSLALAKTRGAQGPGFRLQMGWARLDTGATAEALADMRDAAVADPGLWRAHFGLGTALQAQGRWAEAIASFERAFELHDGDVDCLLERGLCRLMLADAKSAEADFRRALAIEGENASAWNSLGVSLEHQDRYAEARAAYERAARIETQQGQSGTSYVNVALSMQGSGDTQQALELFERNLGPHSGAEAYGLYAQTMRVAGRLPEGWTHFEYRWLKEPLLSDRPMLARPAWSGQDLRGRTILLRAEQGAGDALQFVRYAPLVKAQGATVLLAVPDSLRGLVQGVAGVDRVVGPGDSLTEIDFYVHLLSLPRIFGTDLESIPIDIPYLQVNPASSERWARRFEHEPALKVGLAWAGRADHANDRHRSMSLPMFAPWMDVEGVHFVSLQKGPAGAPALVPPPGFAIEDVSAELHDFADTAAVIGQLDLVISVDTAVAHLAGAMGKPVWLMLPEPAEWRWMERREDSPWYPTMRLFRQHNRGDWSDVVLRIRQALTESARDPAALKAANATALARISACRAPKTPAARLAHQAPGHRPGFAAVAETRHGIMQYLPDEPIMGVAIGWYGDYLQPQLNLLGTLLPPGATVLETGAGAGMHALSIARAIGPAGHLFLYEPRPALQEVLRQNLAANRIGNVTLMRGALGASGAAPHIETVDELQLAQLDGLKLDDGAEALAVLEGATDTLWRLRPWIFAAATDEPTLSSLTAYAKEHGYRCWRKETPLYDPNNFNRRDDDQFGSGTSLALLALPEEIAVNTALEDCREIV